MVSPSVAVARSLECPRGIWRPWGLAAHMSRICSPLIVEERTLPQTLPCDCLEGFWHRRVSIPHRLPEGWEFKTGVWINKFKFSGTQKLQRRKSHGSGWMLLRIWPKLHCDPSFHRAGFILSVVHILWRQQMVPWLWVSRRLSGLLKLEFESGFSCSFSYKWFPGPSTNDFVIVEKWKGILIF